MERTSIINYAELWNRLNTFATKAGRVKSEYKTSIVAVLCNEKQGNAQER